MLNLEGPTTTASSTLQKKEQSRVFSDPRPAALQKRLTCLSGFLHGSWENIREQTQKKLCKLYGIYLINTVRHPRHVNSTNPGRAADCPRKAGQDSRLKRQSSDLEGERQKCFTWQQKHTDLSLLLYNVFQEWACMSSCWCPCRSLERSAPGPFRSGTPSRWAPLSRPGCQLRGCGMAARSTFRSFLPSSRRLAR